MDPALIDRFRADLGALTAPVGVAVSGGPDSLALLLLAYAAFPGGVEAATVDHRLRPESAAEAKFVAGLCAERAIPHAILPVDIALSGEGVQAAARHARYGALGAWMTERGIQTLLTAHHADDQAETFVMRLLRGSGVGGLAAIRRSGPLPGSQAHQILRPLLGWRKSELEAIVAQAGIQPVRDPSNRDERHDRPRIRRLLGETGWLDPQPIVRSAAALADADEALEWAVARLWQERAEEEGGAVLLDPSALPAEIVRRLTLRALAKVDPAVRPRGDEVLRLIAMLEGGGKATLANVLCEGGERWRFAPAPPRRA